MRRTFITKFPVRRGRGPKYFSYTLLDAESPAEPPPSEQVRCCFESPARVTRLFSVFLFTGTPIK